MNPTHNHLEKIAQSQLSELAKFVVTENYVHHQEEDFIENLEEETMKVLEEELSFYSNSEVFVAKDVFGNIQGAIRVTKWDMSTVLPIQSLFNVNPLSLVKNSKTAQSIWHIGRFATIKNNPDRNLFKRLMICAISPICKEKKGIALAECDRKLLRVMNLMGIKTQTVGESIYYLGSETIPISMNYQGLKDFYEKNKYLVEAE
jgi:hypothetical protein